MQFQTQTVSNLVASSPRGPEAVVATSHTVKLFSFWKCRFPDVRQSTIDNIIYFLSHYKEGEKNKYVNIGNIYNKNKALEIIKKYSL